MASSSQAVPAPPHCYHCGVESSNNLFQYFDNKKADQPRYRCAHCRKLFTLGWHRRPQGKTYAKKRNKDPEELKSLSHQCRHCGVADNAAFKYYNNNNLLQPRFKCLSCGKQFQMRLVGTWEERHLVHTSSQQRSAPRPRCMKQNQGQGQGVHEPFPFPYTSSSSSSSSFSSSCEEGIYQPVDDGSLMPIPSDWDWDSVLSLETTSTGLQFPAEKSDEEDDVGFANFLEAELAEEDTSTSAAYFTCWPGNENGSFMQVQAPSDPLVPVETGAGFQFPADMSDEDVLLKLLAEAEGLIGCNDY